MDGQKLTAALLDRSFSALVSACVLVLLSLHGELAGQIAPVTIADEIACLECTIDRVLVSRITDSHFPGGAIGATPVVSVATDTTFFVTSGPSMNELYYADRAGRIRKRIGRDGAGPGEYRQPWYVLSLDSIILVFDLRLLRATRLEKPDFRHAGTISLPIRPVSQPVVLNGDRIVLNGSYRSAAAEVRPVHILSSSSKVVHSIGSSLKPGERRNRVIAASGDTAVWIAQSNDYRLELWSIEGNLLRVIQRNSALFPRSENAERLSAEAPANGEARIKQMFEDDQSRLWIMIGVPRRPSTAMPQRPGADWDKSDSEIVIEVIDLQSLRLSARLRLGGIYPLSTYGRFMDVDYVSAPNGEPVLEVWGYRLRAGNR